jgi:uncharacterized metal-binding protein YceD (DUF177 family)
MSGLYTVPVIGLKEGRYTYEFEIDKDFFDRFEEPEIKEGTLRAYVGADKSPSHLDLNIRIEGSIMIACDRCLGIFSLPVKCENRLLVKIGKIHDESDPDIITVQVDEHEIDLNQYFYEYILLALPIRRTHPADKSGKSTCDPAMLRKLNEHIVTEEHINDPRWDELKRIVNN